MIKNLLVRGLPALTFCVLPLLAAPAAHSASHPAASVPAGEAAAGPAGVAVVVPLFEAINELPVAVEHREGYKRSLYKHWNKGLNSGDGCDTRVICIARSSGPRMRLGVEAF
ncbi:hypothetical protein ACGFZA_42030 [Streptomyces sp. NPDC048211]|uniref:hypothetical protein n=1 Tax=Streptomyces sp. NPDC048211 TaxID=3365516 RepID=UPI00371DC839